MLIDIVGFCPACGNKSLHVESGVGTVHCLQRGCLNPGAAHAILSDPEIEHILEVLPDVETEQSGRWTLKHPLRERVDGDLFSCSVHESLRTHFAFHYPPEPARYRVSSDSGDGRPPWKFEKL